MLKKLIGLTSSLFYGLLLVRLILIGLWLCPILWSESKLPMYVSEPFTFVVLGRGLFSALAFFCMLLALLDWL